MLKSPTPIAVAKKMTVATFLRSNPKFKKLVEVLGIAATRLNLESIDGHWVLDGRFSLTRKRAEEIYLKYRFGDNRDIKETSARCMIADMVEGKWVSIADPGIQFSVEDNRLVMSDGHHRIATAKEIAELDEIPLSMRVVITSAPLEEVYVKTDRGTPKTIRERNKAGKFHERLNLSLDACNRLYEVAVAATCDGRSTATIAERVLFERDETRYDVMAKYRDAFVDIQRLGSGVDDLKAAAVKAGYGGLFTPALRWDVLKHRSFTAVLARLLLEEPALADDVMRFATELVNFNSECQNLSALSIFLSHPLNRTKGGINYEIAYNASLICLRDYINGVYTDECDLVPLMFSTKGKREREAEAWPKNSRNCFEEFEEEVTIGGYTKLVRGARIVKRK